MSDTSAISPATRRRRISELTREIDRLVELDVRWFAAHSGRRFHLRPAFDAELARHELIYQPMRPLKEGCRWMMIICDLGHGYRNCLFYCDCHQLADPADAALREIVDSLTGWRT